PERQNDFGGTLGGPVVIPRLYNGRNRTFFFFSYEGLRLRQPQFALANVPTLALRQQAPASLQPYLNGFPLPNGGDLGNGLAELNASYSNPAQLDATSIRIDHTFGSKFSVFGRYSSAPSAIQQRVPTSFTNVNIFHVDTSSYTVGVTALISPHVN